MACLFNYPRLVFAAATTLRIILLFYGIYQDNHSPLKYTDIDYFVFTDAAKYVSQNRSPYDRDTYRYTPLLSWLLLPTTWGFPGRLNPWFSFGKALFAVADVVAGYLLARILQVHRGLEPRVALQYASIWLLNPMVAVISTRGSAEGLLGVLVTALLWAVLERQLVLAGALLGICVHFKIYPFIYGPAILWFLNVGDQFKTSSRPLLYQLRPNSACITVTAVSLAVFSALNAVMAAIYGYPFIQHTFLHHFTRLDHRHNFSLYNVLLYLSATSPGAAHHFETVAFVPQLLLAAVLIPLVLARRELAGCMLVQTFAFVTFNKVCTSQYFLWYMIFLPLYLPYSSFIKQPTKGAIALAVWIAGQALWLRQAFNLEFLGQSTFIPGLLLASTSFFVANIWILGAMITDVGGYLPLAEKEKSA